MEVFLFIDVWCCHAFQIFINIVVIGVTGFPILGIEWQKMENPDLRKALGMSANQKGVRIRRVEPTAPAAKQLQSSDILLSFDGIDIANDGTGITPHHLYNV